MNVGMTSEELFDLRGFVRGEVISDDMDFLMLGLMSDEVGEECYEPGVGGRGREASSYTEYYNSNMVIRIVKN